MTECFFYSALSETYSAWQPQWTRFYCFSSWSPIKSQRLQKNAIQSTTIYASNTLQSTFIQITRFHQHCLNLILIFLLLHSMQWQHKFANMNSCHIHHSITFAWIHHKHNKHSTTVHTTSTILNLVSMSCAILQAFNAVNPYTTYTSNHHSLGHG